MKFDERDIVCPIEMKNRADIKLRVFYTLNFFNWIIVTGNLIPFGSWDQYRHSGWRLGQIS